MSSLFEALSRPLTRPPHQDTSQGQSLVEYSLLLGLVVFVCIAGVTSLGQAILSKLFDLTTNMF